MFKKFERIKVLGLKNTLLCIYQKILYNFLRAFYKFDKWHSSAPYYCRPYKKVVVDLVNDLNPSRVVEVGCGLGDIISRVNSSEKWGIDIDPKVVKSVRILDKKTFYLSGSFEILDSLGDIDVCIAVNFIHGISPSDFKNILDIIAKKSKYFVVDRYTFEYAKIYKNIFLHFPEKEHKSFKLKKVIPVLECYREIVLYEVIK